MKTDNSSEIFSLLDSPVLAVDDRERQRREPLEVPLLQVVAWQVDVLPEPGEVLLQGVGVERGPEAI